MPGWKKPYGESWGRLRKAWKGSKLFISGSAARSLCSLGPYVVHLALLVILAGALMGRFLGVEGRLTLMEGKLPRTSPPRAKSCPSPSRRTWTDFQVFFYPDGTPSEFRSDLTFTKPGRPPEQALCRVNHPVSFG